MGSCIFSQLLTHYQGCVKVAADVRRRIEECAEVPGKTAPPHVGGYEAAGL